MPFPLLFSMLLLLLLLYVSPREGLRNGTHANGVQPEAFYTRLNTPTDPLYQPKYKDYPKSDVILDMMYFNNATKILSELSLGKT